MNERSLPMMHPSAAEFARTAASTASYFGFRPLGIRAPKTPATKPAPRIPARDRRQDDLYGLLTAGAARYFEQHLFESGHPAFFWSIDHVPRSSDLALGLHVVGVEKSIAEVLLIQTVRSIFAELGFPSQYVQINSLGDRDSHARYARELGAFLKKRTDDLPLAARDLLKTHPLDALAHLIEKRHDVCDSAPNPLEYLSDASRRHFREIVEYLDISHAEYEIDPTLLGNHQCYSGTLFSLRAKADDGSVPDDVPLSARGGRYDEFVRRATGLSVPAIGAVVILRSEKPLARLPRPRGTNDPAVFMVQIGFRPKIRSLLLVEDLKRAEIRTEQAFASDSLSEQLRAAEDLDLPYSLILGQKELVENTVIVRDMRRHSQESVPVPSLVPFLRRKIKAAR